MKTNLVLLAAAAALLSGCVGYAAPYDPGYRGDGGGHQYRDRDRDGVRNRNDRDRDGDGVRNRNDRRPDNPHRN
jgi:hypothetical protein